MRFKDKLFNPLIRLFSQLNDPVDSPTYFTSQHQYRSMQQLTIEAVTGMLPHLVEESQSTVIPPQIWLNADGEPDLTPFRPRLSGGVRVGERNVRSSAHYEGGVELMSVELAPPTIPTEHLTGRWLYFGLAVKHFGHFLIESLGRTWALDEFASGEIDGIVMLLHPDISEQIPDANLELLARVTKLPVRIITVPTLVEYLIIPRQESLSGFGMLSTPRQITALRRRFKHHSSETDEVVYISRAGITYNSSTGKILGGEDIENFMNSSGVRVVRPENLSVEEQLKLYGGAKVIVAEDGSALHLVAVAASSEVTVIVLVRRPWMTLIFDAHLTLFLGSRARIHLIDPPGVRLGFSGEYRVWLSADAPALQRNLATIEPAFAHPQWRPINKRTVELEAREVSEIVTNGKQLLEPLSYLN